MASMCHPVCLNRAGGYSLSVQHPDGKYYSPILNVSGYWPDVNYDVNEWSRYGKCGDSPLLHATRYDAFNPYPYYIKDGWGKIVSINGFTGYFYNPKSNSSHYPDMGKSAAYAVGKEFWYFYVWGYGGMSSQYTTIEFIHLSTACNTAQSPYIYDSASNDFLLPVDFARIYWVIGSSDDYADKFRDKPPEWFLSEYKLLELPMERINVPYYRCGDIMQYLSPVSIEYKRREDIVYQEYLDLDIVDPWFRRGWTTAYYAAVDSLPESTNNVLASMFDVARLFRDVFTRDFGSLPKTLGSVFSSSWLKYRYGYCTTKMDISEYISLNDRLLALSRTDSIRCYGNYHSSDGTFSCSFDVMSEDILPDDVKQVCNLFGLKVNAYNAWDMIPYSFIVDWFIPVGDFLNTIDTRSKVAELRTQNCWMSYHSYYDNGTEVYLRVPGFTPLTSDFPYVNYGTVSDKQICYRTADTIALLAQKGG